jgi:hypothetical protein
MLVKFDTAYRAAFPGGGGATGIQIPTALYKRELSFLTPVKYL